MRDFEGDAPRRKRQLALLPLLTLLHLAVLLGLNTHWQQSKSTQPDSSVRIEMRLLAPPAPKQMAVPEKRPQIASRSQIIATQRRELASAKQALTQTAPVDASPPPTEPATEPTKAIPLLNTEATRQAIRQATRSPLLSERAAAAMGDGLPLERSEVLGQEIKKAGNGDCLKGDFLGGGMGLLSAPFWLLAEARGKCAR